MNKSNAIFALITTVLIGLTFGSCGRFAKVLGPDEPEDTTTLHFVWLDPMGTDEVPTHTVSFSGPDFNKTYLKAELNDEAAIYKKHVDSAKALIVVSKREYRLYVYETGADTTLAASFPICYALNPGPKTKEGDNCTPECTMHAPFHVSEIKDASTWVFDFGDGRGSILAFGHWFMRLDLSQSFPDNPALATNRSIGIHGSTGNEASIPGRDSHGCIRLLDRDLDTLHDNYIGVGTTVVVKGIHTPKLPFELKAEKALGEDYHAAFITDEGEVWIKGE